MGILDFLRGADINAGIERYRATPGAVLLDVRTPQEYREGHVPQSVNVPLQALEQLEAMAVGRQTPLFVYCLSGARSRQAAAALQQMGYSNVTDIGGISRYRGETER